MTTALTTFAAEVLAACERIPAVHRPGRKAFISHAWAVGGFEVSLAEFKAELLEAHRAGGLTLGRCDLVEAFDARDVRRSMLDAGGFEFHLIRM